jgi:hypothetical protein
MASKTWASSSVASACSARAADAGVVVVEQAEQPVLERRRVHPLQQQIEGAHPHLRRRRLQRLHCELHAEVAGELQRRLPRHRLLGRIALPEPGLDGRPQPLGGDGGEHLHPERPRLRRALCVAGLEERAHRLVVGAAHEALGGRLAHLGHAVKEQRHDLLGARALAKLGEHRVHLVARPPGLRLDAADERVVA